MRVRMMTGEGMAMGRLMKLGCLVAVALFCCGSLWAEGIEQSVVKIVNQYNMFNWYAPWDSGSTGKGTGSGFVISKNRIMTNAHVVSDTAMLLVYFHNDPTPYPAKVTVIAHDCDLAVLELVDPKRLEEVPPLEFDGLPAIRSQVFTYGYPAGGKRLSITAGVVSRIEMKSYVHSGVDQHLVVQTDAAINPGNSGGPVVQDQRVVGVAFQGNSKLENMGVFIPTEIIQHFLTDLEDGTYDGYPELGIIAAKLENPAARAYAGMSADETGIRLDSLVRGCSAESVLKPGDIVTHVNGYPVANDGTISWKGLRLDSGFLIDQFQKGGTVPMRVIRGGERLAVDVPLKHYNPNPWLAKRYEQQPEYYIYAGLVFVPLNRETLETYGSNWYSETNQELIYDFYFRPNEKQEPLDTPFVMQIRRLDHAVNAEESRFLYQIIESANGQKINTLQELASALESATDPQQVIRFKYGNVITVLDREKAEAAHPEILKQYGIPKDRNL